MMKPLLALLLTLLVCSPVLPQGARTVTAAEANGTYLYRHNEIKV